MWKKYITRRVAVQVAQAWNYGWGESMKQLYGVSLSDTLVFRDEKKTEYWVNERQHDEYVQGLYNLLEDKTFVRIFHTEARANLEMILFKTQKMLHKDFSQLTNSELLNLYTKWILPSVEQFYIRMWTVFNIGEPLSHVIKEKLKNYLKDEDEIIEHLLTLSTPLQPNDVIKKRIHLLQIKNELPHLHVNKKEYKLKQHTSRFQHIPMFDFDHEPLVYADILHELEEIEDAKTELNDLNTQLIQNKKQFYNTLKHIQPDPELKLLLQFLQENVHLRDYRDMIRQKLNLELKKFYTETGKRIGLNIKQVAVLTNEEIIKHLGQNKSFDKKEIIQREQSYLFIQKGQNTKIYSGPDAIRKATEKLHPQQNKTHEIIQGVVGSKGYAYGKAKIIYTNKDLYKIETGDILITSMTRQDFIPAIRKAVALVTD
ncbi:hypothetical protein C0581_02825 [Candidatus Parcubacteria bacterium]|nr:MAG: hypothetical protein C0581_02825 [Candidatus Parcubacteria bacterium]